MISGLLGVMSRRTINKTEVSWTSALDLKPIQGDRVLLKIEDCGNVNHVIGYWSGSWVVCDILIKSSDAITEDFEQGDVLAYAYII